MLYSSERSKQIIKRDVPFLGAGVHDDVLLVGIRHEQSPTGSSFLEFSFEKDGKTMKHTEWKPQGEPTDEIFINKCTNQLSRIQQILSCFHPKDVVENVEAADFDGLANWTIDLYNKADKNTKLRVKIVYNDNGYTTLPKYAKYTFIEPMSVVQEGKSVIVELSIDKFEKPVAIVADNEQTKDNPFEVVNGSLTAGTPTDGLPF